MKLAFKTIITEQLIFIGVVYIFVFAFLKIKSLSKKHLNIQNFVLLVLTGGTMSLAYYLFLCETLVSVPVLIILFGGMVYFMLGLGQLLVSHLMAFFVMPFLGRYATNFKQLIVIVLFSILIVFMFDKTNSSIHFKALAICGIPLLATNIFYFRDNFLQIILISIISVAMIKIAVIDSCRVIEDFNKYQSSYDQHIIDPLTGLYNRRKMDTLNNAQEAISIVIIDIDDFKDVNDKYGHVAGDICLKGVAEVIMGCCTPDEIPLRFGGDEFMIICKNKTKEYTSNLAEKIRCSISRYNFTYNQWDITITVSIGIKNFDHNIDVEKLISEADVAMYCSKSTGKNTVTAT